MPLANMHSQEPRLSTEEKRAIDGTAISFHLYPNKFVQELTDCFYDDDCRIYYYHFEKSGGTSIEQRMARLFPPRLNSCCGPTLMERFRVEPIKYCEAKFSSYQVGRSEFLDEIVPTCIAKTGARAVVLVSFREPIQRTLSYIHQKCNKHLWGRSDAMKRACRTCSYEQDKVFWDDIVQLANS